MRIQRRGSAHSWHAARDASSEDVASSDAALDAPRVDRVRGVSSRAVRSLCSLLDQREMAAANQGISPGQRRVDWASFRSVLNERDESSSEAETDKCLAASAASQWRRRVLSSCAS